MKHLNYGHQVFAISDLLATTIEEAALLFMNAGRFAIWPVACYVDDRDHTSVQVAFGPGIPFTISDPQLPDRRDFATHDADSIFYITSERESLEIDLDLED